jgi:outer membrane receptor protein involved in Fe transport
MYMTRYFMLTALLVIGLPLLLVAQTSLGGKVTDEDSKEPLSFSTVVLFKNGVYITGTPTDLDGNYNFTSIDPGTYEVEVGYTGYQTQRVEGVMVLAGKANKLDVALSNVGGVMLDEVVVTEYRNPLIEQDNTTSGAVITSEQIQNLATRNINAIASTAAGLSTSDEGGAITIRGSRSNATDYYVDGVRVFGSLIPETEIDQLQIITGGMEARYGDVTGGVISITTKGPSAILSGGVEVESSNMLDPYDNTLVGFNLSGPIWRNKATKSPILGFRLSGRYTSFADDDPPAIDVFTVKPSVLQELEANPIVRIGGTPFVAADFLTQEDAQALDYRPNEGGSLLDLTAKIDARISPSLDMTLTGAFRNSENQFTPGGWRLMNSHNNPISNGNTFRGNFRFRHRFGIDADGRQKKTGFVQNASYTLQAGYELTENNSADQRLGENYFDYGYIGKFDIDWVPTFVESFNPQTGEFFLIHTDYREILRSYTPGTKNPVRANFNNAMGLDFGSGEPLNPNIGEYLITNLQGTTPGISRTSFFAQNGTISSVFTNSWNFHRNVGDIYSVVARSKSEILSFNGNLSFDLVPGSSDKARHSIELGFMYEERLSRSYNVFPVTLWDVARQQANNHILGIGENRDTASLVDYENYPRTALYGLTIAEGADNLFYKRVRESLGLPLDAFLNVDGLDPEQLRLDMFSAKELNDQGLLSYFGYDYLGNEFNGTFDDFFTATEDGVRTFPVAPNRPTYAAVYLQDKFTFRDIIFRLGVRIDRYDANTRVLKDNYSLYDIMGAGQFHAENGSERPGNIGDDYKVYLDETGADVQAYRDGDQWYRGDGTPVNSAIEIEGIRTGLVNPKFVYDQVTDDPNFIKSRDFDINASFEDYRPELNIMPRLAFSFPISEDANFFAHYDILVQRPASNTLATPLNYFYFIDGASNLINNPNLRPERTIDYEVGFQQKLSMTSALKISAYYKEMRDMIQSRTFFPVPFVNQYTTYDNQDFGTVKGFSLQYDLRRTGNLSLQTNYTIQFADGTGSNSDSQRGISNRGNLRNLFPLDFDERHRINLNLDYRYLSGKRYNGPRIAGVDIFSNAGLSLQLTSVSGRPYTARELATELGGTGTVGAINGARKPWNFFLNARVDKTFRIDNRHGINVYFRVSNVLDRRNIINVYPVTGSPTDSGFLNSPNGENQLISIENSVRTVESYLASYQWALLNPNLYSLPRRMYLGARFTF